MRLLMASSVILQLMTLLKIVLFGYGILAFALVINIVASKFGLASWYGFLQSSKRVKVTDVFWLFILYPLSLGVCGYGAMILIF